MNSFANHPMQTQEWKAAREAMGVRVEKIIDNGHIFQFTVHPVPYTPYSVGYLPRTVMPSGPVLKELYEFGKKNNLIFVKLEPYIKYEDSFRPSDFKNVRLIKSSHPLFPEWTQTLDLTPPEEQLFKNLKPKTRYNVRLAEKKGVVVKEVSTDEGYAIFEKLYFETCKRQHYHGHTPQYHQSIWNALKGTQAHILIAYLGEVPLAAYELLYFKNNLYYLYGGSTTAHKNVMAPNLLMWEAIKLGKKLGATTFDMWGSLPPGYSSTHSWAGFTRFKEGYATNFTHLSASFDLVINPLLYKIYNFVYKIREKLL
jgi:lipid II:glycine glycyltransferase (peptidoglycan interpeptide bridge formation enzyme)